MSDRTKNVYEMIAAHDEDKIKMLNERAAEASKKIKLIADRDVIEFLDVEGLIGKISVEPVEQLKNYNRKVAALKNVDVLFLITDEIMAEKIAGIVDNVRMDQLYNKPIRPKYAHIDVEIIVVILREKFELHVKKYIINEADTTTVIPYRHNQDAVIHALLKTMVDAFNRDDQLFKFLTQSKYFAYDINGQCDNRALEYYGDHFAVDGITFYTPHPISLETEFSVKVFGVGKNHYVGKMKETIAYEDINDLKTPSDIKRAVDFVDFPCLIIEFDDAHFKKAEVISEVRDGAPFVVFVPTESFVESEWADVTIKVKPEDREKLVRDINRFELGREDFFDPIGFDMCVATFECITPDELDALDDRLKTVKQLYIEIICRDYDRDHDEARKIYEGFKAKDCTVECVTRYRGALDGIEIYLYMSDRLPKGDRLVYDVQ